MICLLDTEETPDVGIFTRLRRARRGYKGVTCRDITVLGMRALYITIDKSPSLPQKTVLKRIGYAAQMMHTGHVTEVLFSKKFPYRAEVLREGFVETDKSLLTELLAGEIAAGLAGKEKAVAAIFAQRLIGPAERVLNDLCRDFRYVMAIVEEDSSRLIAVLEKRLGISVIMQPNEKQLLKADVAVFFSSPREKTVLSDNCVALPIGKTTLNGVVCRKAVTGLTVEPREGRPPELPEGFDYEQLYALAIKAGRLRREDLRLVDINIANINR